ncbi:unnamed protein product [Pseudo-nitzschia multistriata]|uniref:Uncharacterized protein n=1 Tax=Pseudo-nitzschia multistriata TaxID=183589 RepID=A0A448Z8G7_9STRA|nr:unnamed protein product [Pseudo-nitzschia multistriata]
MLSCRSMEMGCWMKLRCRGPFIPSRCFSTTRLMSFISLDPSMISSVESKLPAWLPSSGFLPSRTKSYCEGSHRFVTFSFLVVALPGDTTICVSLTLLQSPPTAWTSISISPMSKAPQHKEYCDWSSFITAEGGIVPFCAWCVPASNQGSLGMGVQRGPSHESRVSCRNESSVAPAYRVALALSSLCCFRSVLFGLVWLGGWLAG